MIGERKTKTIRDIAIIITGICEFTDSSYIYMRRRLEEKRLFDMSHDEFEKIAKGYLRLKKFMISYCDIRGC